MQMIRMKKNVLLILTIIMLGLLPIGFYTSSIGSIFPFVDANSESEGMEDATDANASDDHQQTDQNFNAITPVAIEIPAINVEAEIEEAGVLDNGEMGVPSDEDGVAWFEPGPKPGADGNAVMAGHVDSYEGPAIFYDLEDLDVGDEIIVRDVEGKELTFNVQTQESYPLGEAPMDRIFGFADARNLNLITCTGTFNQEQGTHEERLVIFSELDEEKSDID